MTMLKSVICGCVLTCCAAASAQDFVYRPNYAAQRQIYYDPLPRIAIQDRFVHRENYAAKRHDIRYRVPSYAEYYLRKHNELPRWGYPGEDIRHLNR
jgi:hypothetical protein